MNLDAQTRIFSRQALVVATTATLSLIAAGPLQAATPAPDKIPAASASATEPAQSCLKHLIALRVQMQKDGYWRGVSGYGYGYPTYGYDYDASMASPAITSASAPAAERYWRARPGYEVRTLLAATQILARHGQQAACESLLGETRKIYGRYATEMRNGHLPKDNISGFLQAQLAAAQPVAGHDVSFRSDQLIGTDVVEPTGEELGSVDDLVLSPQTGKIAYLVIARGGMFGIDEKYVPVPWAHFKATNGAKILVLDTTKAVLSAAPHVEEHGFSKAGDFGKQSQQVDTYWSAHRPK